MHSHDGNCIAVSSKNTMNVVKLPFWSRHKNSSTPGDTASASKCAYAYIIYLLPEERRIGVKADYSATWQSCCTKHCIRYQYWHYHHPQAINNCIETSWWGLILSFWWTQPYLCRQKSSKYRLWACESSCCDMPRHWWCHDWRVYGSSYWC